MGCLFNPIEEFFACFDSKLHKNITSFLINKNFPMTQEIFNEMIHKSIYESANMDLKQIFRRAGLLEE